MTYAPVPVRTDRPAEARTMAGLALTLLVMGVVSLGCMGLVSQQARSLGGTGEGEGDVGQVKMYLQDMFESTFLCLALVLLAGSVTTFVLSRRYRRG